MNTKAYCINKLGLGENELENLHQEYKKLVNAKQIIQACDNALKIIDDHNFFEVQNQLNRIQELDPIISINKLFEDALIHISEATHELRHYSDKINIDPDRLQFIDLRLNAIYDLARKHRVKPEELHLQSTNLKDQLDSLNNADIKLATLQQKIAKFDIDYKKAAVELSSSRKQAAKKLELEISHKMEKLNMPEGKFEVQFCQLEENNFSAYGLEQIEFLVSMNAGQPPLPLTKVVSGGELSRLSLAIQVITAQKGQTPVLIFDEVDAGIGGKTAQVVGELLKKLSEKSQILCVTHLPQIAAQGHHNFQVSKKNSKGNTIAVITKLTPVNKITEIARMLGGAKITASTLAHAKELCENFV
jgi:DNA repair protein RecN (Recombination protein N)